MTSFRRQIPRASGLWSCAALLMLTGCEESGSRKYEVTGVVTYDGQIVPNGTVTYLGANDQSIIASIGIDGRYQCEAPAGTYKVGIHAPRENTATGMDAFRERGKPPYVPVNFSLPKLTGIEVTVRDSDDNEIDLKLISGKQPRKRRGHSLTRRPADANKYS